MFNFHRFFLHWHRKIGLFSLFFIILLIITGILLNHTSEINLDKKYIQNKVLLNWYRIKPPQPIIYFKNQKNSLFLFNQQLYFNQKLLEIENIKALKGFIERPDDFLILLADQLLIIDKQGDLLEIISTEDGLPEYLTQLAFEQNQLYLKSNQDTYLFDIENITATKITLNNKMNWSNPRPAPPDLMPLYQDKGLSFEQLILDLHSGRFFGIIGVYFIDFIGLLMLFLSLSGAFMWCKRQTKKNKRT